MVGHDFDILFQATVEDWMMVQMLIWKIWQLCNDIVQGRPLPPVESTRTRRVLCISSTQRAGGLNLLFLKKKHGVSYVAIWCVHCILSN
jgi:hypothetical protein